MTQPLLLHTLPPSPDSLPPPISSQLSPLRADISPDILLPRFLKPPSIIPPLPPVRRLPDDKFHLLLAVLRAPPPAPAVRRTSGVNVHPRPPQLHRDHLHVILAVLRLAALLRRAVHQVVRVVRLAADLEPARARFQSYPALDPARVHARVAGRGQFAGSSVVPHGALEGALGRGGRGEAAVTLGRELGGKYGELGGEYHGILCCEPHVRVHYDRQIGPLPQEQPVRGDDRGIEKRLIFEGFNVSLILLIIIIFVYSSVEKCGGRGMKCRISSLIHLRLAVYDIWNGSMCIYMYIRRSPHNVVW